MSCTLEFPESSVKIDFCSKGNKQKILIDVLTKYGDMNINTLASVLEVPVKRLHDICDGHGFLVGEQADSLAQLFLMFLGKHFFRKCTLIRNFVDYSYDVCLQEGVEQRFNSEDTTTFSVTGESYPDSDEHAISVTHGYSKDHRPDLKQVVHELMVSQDGGVPLQMKTWNGKESDTVIFVSAPATP